MQRLSFKSKQLKFQDFLRTNEVKFWMEPQYFDGECKLKIQKCS